MTSIPQVNINQEYLIATPMLTAGMLADLNKILNKILLLVKFPEQNKLLSHQMITTCMFVGPNKKILAFSSFWQLKSNFYDRALCILFTKCDSPVSLLPEINIWIGLDSQIFCTFYMCCIILGSIKNNIENVMLLIISRIYTMISKILSSPPIFGIIYGIAKLLFKPVPSPSWSLITSFNIFNSIRRIFIIFKY